jgi:hypothetical protein
LKPVHGSIIRTALGVLRIVYGLVRITRGRVKQKNSVREFGDRMVPSMSTDDLIYGIPILVVVQFILRTCWARWMQKWAKKKNLRSLYWVSFWLPTIGFLIVLFSRTRPSSYQDVLARPIEFNLADEKVTEVKN